jgi:MFS transporter, DHA2 family, multidrug resistance protein
MDTFWILGALCSLMFVLAFFLKKNDPGAGARCAILIGSRDIKKRRK